MNLPRDLVEMLSVFDAVGVRYLVVGGHAVSLHAKPRSTKDLDLWIEPTPENTAAVCLALTTFGIPAHLIEAVRAARDDEIVWMGKVPARVDFLRTLPGLTFAPTWARRSVVEIDGVRVSMIGRDDLITNKTVVGRPQDLRDVRALERAKAAPAPAAKKRPPRK